MKRNVVYSLKKIILIMIIFMFIILLSACSNDKEENCSENGCEIYITSEKQNL
jgi:uncharacterized lipoprotein